MTQPHISLAAEAVTHISGVPITNSLVATWIVMVFLVIVAVYAGRSLKKKPGYFQVFIELLIGGLFKFFEQLGGEQGKKFVPILVTFFLFILVSNWAGLLPGFGTIGFNEAGAQEATKIVQKVLATTPEVAPLEKKEVGTVSAQNETKIVEAAKPVSETPKKGAFVPLLRGPTADLNTTIALGLIAFSLIQYAGFKASGLGYLKKFLNFSNPINTFIGILEIVSDISKIISFAFRLFGNVFAGEVLLAVMASFLPVFLPLPFLGLELFVGVIQALVFAMLTAVFINLAVSHGDHGGSKEHTEAHA